MFRLAATLRIAMGLVFLTASLVLAARSFGFLPDYRESVLDGRRKLCESLAINCSLFAQEGREEHIRAALTASAKRNSDILSAAVRRVDGSILAEFGDHVNNWKVDEAGVSDAANMFVPIAANNRPWGTVEVRFRPLARAGWIGLLDDPIFPLLGFVLVGGLVVYGLYLQKMLQHLDPSRVIPGRVRAALDTFAEGLLVLDKNERIVLANKAFAQTVGCPAKDLQGRRASEFAWSEIEEGGPHPWREAIREGMAQTGVVLGLRTKEDERRFRVNATPIEGEDGRYRGALASFDDVTEAERSREELREMLSTLQQSRDEISRQNVELHRLATRDPLTSCLNRRSFFAEFQVRWDRAATNKQALSCIMLDIDYFKSINDRHGHDTGDQVLVGISETLKDQARPGDLVCRYGGEEFALLLPDTDLDEAHEFAEGIRQAIESTRFDVPQLLVTASLGVSANRLGARNPQDLLKQADECLYAAKGTGRNRAIRYDTVPELPSDDDTPTRETTPIPLTDGSAPIPFHAIAVLMSALNYRDPATAEHSRRVADLCVAAASSLMSLSDAYVLEIAALLHDIGKIGVPDAILLKPGPLTQDEWKVMQVHDKMGVEIIRSAFVSEKLSLIVENHHAWYGGKPDHPDLPTGNEIPLGARILSICDAYDAIVSDRVYRKGRDRAVAFEELRRCAGTQFDPELVEVFINSVLAADRTRNNALPDVSPEAALRIGMEIEHLAAAMDRADLTTLATLAARLKNAAEANGIRPIADAAELLQSQVTEEQELLEIVRSTGELLDLCRATQAAYLNKCEASRPAGTVAPVRREATIPAAVENSGT